MSNAKITTKRICLIISIALVLSIGFCLQSSASDESPVFHKTSQVRYTSAKTWLYRTIDKKAMIIKKSMQLKVTGISSDGWTKVSYKKKSYFIKSRYLMKTNGYLVAIDAGHQQKGNSAREPVGPGAKARKAKVASGATGKYSKIPEYKLTLIMAQKVERELKARGYNVKMIRTKNKVNISNAQRAKIANKVKADAFIRIHANAAGSSSVKGALTISPTKNNPYCKKVYTKCRNLSQAVLTEFCSATGAKNRGIMYTDSMSGINWSKVPVTIVEMGFLTNKTEDLKMNRSKLYQQKMTRGMANGIDRYFNRK